MKLEALKDILKSPRGSIQSCIVYERETDLDLAYGCSVEYAVKTYGDRIVKNITSLLENGEVFTLITV